MKKSVSKSTKTTRFVSSPSSLETLGLNVKLLRSMRRLTQENLAELAGMKRGQVGEMERGTRGIRLETLDRLAKALGVEPWELLRPRDSAGR